MLLFSSRTVRVVALVALVPWLASCAALTGLEDAATPLDVFVLQPPDNLPLRQGAPLPRDIIIEEPTTGGDLATERVMIRPDALQAQYLPGIRWPDPAPIMIQTLMVRALDATGAFQYVGRRPLGPGGDYAIVTEIEDFQAERLPGSDSARIDVRLISRIVREEGVQIVATRRMSASAIAPDLSDAAIIAAFNEATGQVIGDFAEWTLSTLGAI